MKNPRTLTIPTLPKGRKAWRDNGGVMFNACFTLLADCVENEHLLDGSIDWTANEQSREAKAEIEALYDWWNKVKNDDDWSPMTSADIDKSAGPSGKSTWSRRVNVDEQYEEADKMLIRLIKIRRFLYV